MTPELLPAPITLNMDLVDMDLVDIEVDGRCVVLIEQRQAGDRVRSPRRDSPRVA